MTPALGEVPDQIRWILRMFEGEVFTEDPIDTGGATKYGITLRTLRAYRSRRAGRNVDVTPGDVAALGEPEAVAIGVAIFAEESHLDLIRDAKLRLACLDYAFHAGWVPAVRSLQLVVAPNIVIDGIFGPQTAGAVNRLRVPSLAAEAVCTIREQRLIDRIRTHPDQKRFASGWWTRVSTIRSVIEGG